MAIYIENGSVAIGTSRAKQIVVVGLAEGLAVALEKVARAQLLGAVGAGEVFRVPGLAQRGDHLSDNGLLAGAAAALLARVDTLATHVCLQVAEHRVQVVLLGGRLRWARVLGRVRHNGLLALRVSVGHLQQKVLKPFSILQKWKQFGKLQRSCSESIFSSTH